MSAALLTDKSRSLGRRGMIPMTALVATVASAFAMAAGPVSSANAEGFCGWMTLGPNQQCHLPQNKAQDILLIDSYGEQRASCVALLGYYGEQLDSWVCAAKDSTAYYGMPSWRPFGYYRAAIKNNNLTQSGKNFIGHVYPRCLEC